MIEIIMGIFMVIVLVQAGAYRPWDKGFYDKKHTYTIYIDETIVDTNQQHEGK